MVLKVENICKILYMFRKDRVIFSYLFIFEWMWGFVYVESKSLVDF